MLEAFSEFEIALPEQIHRAALDHLVRQDGQEDLSFGLWVPSRGRRRLTALVSELILPEKEDRALHGNASFSPAYFTRALGIAVTRGKGLFLMHSHLGPGWQHLSRDDHQAEASHAGAVLATTNFPFLGLTAGVDGAWSARFWQRAAPRRYEPHWCQTVRVVGEGLRTTYHPSVRSGAQAGAELERTIGVLGTVGQKAIARLRVGIVGLGSVGSIVCESLARLGIETLSVIDHDIVERRNLDRILGATQSDIGRLKVDVAVENAQRSATSRMFHADRYPASVVEEEGYRAALDCDLLFSCVDRPWPRRVLNHVAYAHVIPVIDGGILVRVRGERLVGADWRAHTVGPTRRCLECLEAFDPSLVGIERDGFLDDPSYLAQLDPDHFLLRHENVFPFSLHVAALEVLQLVALMVGPIRNLGQQTYHYATGTLGRTDDAGCDPSCLYPGLIASGDVKYCVTGMDHAAEKRRRHTLARTAP